MAKRSFSFLALTILIAIEIFYFSSLTGGKGTGNIPFIAIAYHFTVFFLLAFFLISTLKSKHTITTLIISIFYAISDEIHQIYVPLRHGGIPDIIIDTFGICCGILIYLHISKNKSKYIQKENITYKVE